MATTTTNTIVCPSCGTENIEGEDSCQHCLADLRSLDVPESRQVASESDLSLPVSSIRFSRPQTVGPAATVGDAIEAMLQGSSGAVVVVDSGRIAGIFTERDVLKRVAGRPE